MQKKLTKPFITYFEQLNNLIQKKHLNISNLSYAKNKLLNIGYYSLIDGYKDIFYNPMTRTYEKGTNFTDMIRDVGLLNPLEEECIQQLIQQLSGE